MVEEKTSYVMIPTKLIGRNKKNPSEVAFQLYNPYMLFSSTIYIHQDRYDLTRLHFNICGTINNTTKELTVYIKPVGALFHDGMVKTINKSRIQRRLFYMQIKEDSIG